MVPVMDVISVRMDTTTVTIKIKITIKITILVEKVVGSISGCINLIARISQKNAWPTNEGRLRSQLPVCALGG